MVHDSLLDDLDAPVDQPFRRLRFSDGHDHDVHVLLTLVGTTERNLAIQATPPRTAELQIEVGPWRGRLVSNSIGHALVTDVPPGLLRLVVEWPQGDSVQTACVQI